MKASEMRDHLIRAKLYYGQSKTKECIGLVIVVLRALGDATPASDVAGALRDLMLLLGKDSIVTDVLGKELVFAPGQEKNILVGLAHVFKAIMSQQEDHETAMARKLNIDKYFNEGLHCIKENKLSEAVQNFDDAIKYYKDEHSLFILIGQALMDAEAPKRAFPYLSKGLIAAPQDARMQSLYEQCVAIKDKKK